MVLGTLYPRLAVGEPMRTRAILATSLVKHFKLDVEISDPDDVFPSQHYRQLVPGFRWPDGSFLPESVPICLARNGGLLGDASIKTRSQILRWMVFTNYDVMGPSAELFRQKVGRKPKDKKLWDINWEEVQKVNDIMEDHLTKNEYLLGNQLTLADLFAVQMYFRGIEHLYDDEYRARFPKIFGWWAKVTKNEIFGGFFEQTQFLKKLEIPSWDE